MPYATVSFRITLSDLAKYLMTRSVARATAELGSITACNDARLLPSLLVTKNCNMNKKN